MDRLIEGLNAASHAAEDAGAIAGHGQSFADTAAGVHGAPEVDAGSPAAPEKAAAAKPGGGSSSWWDEAVGAVKSAAGKMDGAVHVAGHAIDQAAGSVIDSATGAARDVAGDEAANALHGAAEAACDTVKQGVGFTYGVGEGATEAVGGMVEGTAGLVRNGGRMATDPAFRGQVVAGAEKLASEVASHPGATARALGSGLVHGGEDWLRGAGKAAQEGSLGEYLGKGAGSAAVNGGSFLVPGAGEAEAAGVAGRIGEVGEVTGRFSEIAVGVEHSAQSGSGAARTAAAEGAKFGNAASSDYRATFFTANPKLQGKVIVHHAVEQQVMTRYPGLVSTGEIQSLENLRGIPKEANADLHLSQIRREWNRFYRQHPSPTQQQLLQKATEIDMKLGSHFNPPVEYTR